MPVIRDYKENRAKISGAITLGAILWTVILAGSGLLVKIYVDKQTTTQITQNK